MIDNKADDVYKGVISRWRTVMRQVKTKKKAYELAQNGKLFYIENNGYRQANIGMVISMFETMTFYYRK